MVIFWYCNFKNMIIKRFFHALGNCNNIELSGEKQKKRKNSILPNKEQKNRKITRKKQGQNVIIAT